MAAQIRFPPTSRSHIITIPRRPHFDPHLEANRAAPSIRRCRLLLVCCIRSDRPDGRKRPLSHADYDIWKTITGMTLSPDGKWVCYTQAAKGDATFVVKNIASGHELKFAKGGAAAAPSAGIKGRRSR